MFFRVFEALTLIETLQPDRALDNSCHTPPLKALAFRDTYDYYETVSGIIGVMLT